MTREMTPPKPNDQGGTTIRVQRCCNGCGREIGDANDQEMESAVSGSLMPDVRAECGCADAPNIPEWTEIPVENLVTPIHRGRTVDCGTGEHFIFTGLTYDPDETGDRFTVHGRNGKWSASATLRPGDVVLVQAKEARA